MKRLLLSLTISISALSAKKGDIFVVIEPPAAIQQNVIKAQKSLAGTWKSSSITFHKPHDLHITLQLIGNVLDQKDPHYISPAMLKMVIKSLKESAEWLSKKDPTFRLTKDKVAQAALKVWPSHAVFLFPRSDTLTAFVMEIRSRLKHNKVPYNWRRIDYPNKAHMSIAHIPKGTALPAEKFSLGSHSFPVGKILLKQSVFEDDRRYKTIAEFDIK